MKKFLFFNILIIFLFTLSCSYKPLYQKKISGQKINIFVKSKEKYENDVSLMKLLLNEKINYRSLKPSSLKLVVSIEKTSSGLGINKDLHTYGQMLIYNVNYAFYDQSSLLSSGNLTKKASYNISSNSYSNIVSLEDASQKLISSLSENLSNIIISEKSKRKNLK